MKKSLANILKADFSRNVATLTSGNIVATAITFGATPIVTRLFLPHEFGVFALYMAVVAVLAQVCCLCYERAILLPVDEADAFDAAWLSLFVLTAFCAFLLVFTLTLGDVIHALLGAEEVYDWRYLLPLSVLIVGIANIFRYIAIRQRRFRLVSSGRITEALSGSLTKILLGVLIGGWAGGLIMGSLFGVLVATILLYTYLEIRRRLIRNLRNLLVRLRALAVEYKQFPLYASWNALLTMFVTYLPVFLLAAFFGPAVVGLYNVANRLLMQPIQTVSSSVSKVYFQKSASQSAAGQKILPGLFKATFVLAATGVAPFVVLAIFGEEIFELVFGERWREAGSYAQVMAPWFLLMFIRAPSFIVFEVCQRQQERLVLAALNAALSVAIAGGIYFGGGSAKSVILGIVAVNSLMILAQILLAVRVARQHDSGALHRSTRL